MKVVINGKVYDPNVTQIIIVFKDDNDRVGHVRNLDNMATIPGPRVYSIHPHELHPKDVLSNMQNAIQKTYP